MCVGLTAVLLQSCVNSVSIVSSLSSVSSVHSKQCSVAVQTWNLSKSFRPKLLPTKSMTVSTYFTTAEVHQNQQFGSFLVRFELKVQHFHTFTSLSHKVFIFSRKLCKSKCCFLRIFTTVRNFTRPGCDGRDKGAGAFHSAGQSKEGSVGFGTSQHPIFMKLLPDHLWH